MRQGSSWGDNECSDTHRGPSDASMGLKAQVNNDATLEIVLKMVMEPDLRLKFGSSGQYVAWKQGLEACRRLLELPTDVLHDDLLSSSGSSQPLFAAQDVPHGLLRVLLLESEMPGASSRLSAFRV